MRGRIWAGTASWTDPGFVANWYPPGLPASYRLRWYADHFNLVEVNSTFYRIPEAKSVKSWCDETPAHFKFNVKLHRLLSRHSTKPELLPPVLRAKLPRLGRVDLTPRLERDVVKCFLKGIQPLADCGKLGALVLQLSPAFSPRYNQLADLDHLFECLQGYLTAVEFRNRGWVSDEMIPKTKQYLSLRKIIFVMVDGPEDSHFMVMPNLDLVTNHRLAYFRAHGRNAPAYVRKRTVAERFDYDYSKRELEEIAERVAAAASEVREVHVVYNNNKADYAPRAAAAFQQIITERYPEGAPLWHRKFESEYELSR